MSWPLSQDYNEAIQSPHDNFRDPDLQRGEPVVNALGIPMPRSGNFADVYELRCPNGSHWAVKCFTREVPNLRERYAAISRHLQDAKLPFTVDFTFVEQGIRVGGCWYPVLKMQWVEGLTLNEFVRQHADKPGMMTTLLQIWVRMAGRLREAGIAHADLQHGNVLLVPGSTANSLAVKLVDYDGLFVPALAGIPSGEVGHPCYQHPQRLAERTYSLEVDRFPLLLVAAALEGLKVGGRALWDKHDSGDNLLFREADLQAPSKSPLFYELLKLGDARASRLASQTLDALKGRLEATPLLEEVLPELHAPAAPKSAVAKRTTVVKAAAIQPSAQTPATDSAWDFDGEDKPRRRRRRKSAMPRWVWGLAVSGVTAVVLMGGIFALAFWGETEKPKDKGQIVRNNLQKTPRRNGEVPESADSKETRPNGNPHKENSGSPSSNLKGATEAQSDAPAEASTADSPSQGESGSTESSKPTARFAIHKESVGPWHIEKDMLLVDHPWGNQSYPNIYFGDKDWVDYDFTVDVNRLARPAHCALWFRHTTAGNAYHASFGKGSKLVTLETTRDNRYSGVQREVPLIENDRWYTLRAVVRGSRIRIYVDGELMFDQPDEVHPKGCVGLHVNSSKFAFRNIKVTDPAGKVLLQGLPDLPQENGEVKPAIAKKERKTAPPESSKPAAAEGFVALFNGADLKGWRIEPGDAKQWQVDGDTIVGHSETSRSRSYLLTDKEYEDFVLRFEYKIGAGHHGVALRAITGERVPLNNQLIFDHPLITLSDSQDAKEPIGTTHWVQNVDTFVQPKETHQFLSGEWHTMEVAVRGDKCTAAIDDRPIVDLTLDTSAAKAVFVPALRRKKGRIGFQTNIGTISFRNIAIKEVASESSSSRVQDDRAAEPAEAAAKLYEKSCTAAREKLLKAFDSALDQLAKRKGSTDARQKMIDTVKEEKERFESRGWIPWSEPMRPHVDQYLKVLTAAQGKLSRVYESLIDAQRRAKNESKADDLRAELKDRLDIRVMARWRYFINGRETAIHILYSNGRIGSSEGKAAWFYDKGKLIFRFPGPQAPGGAWIDTLQVSADGATLEGTNNDRPERRPNLRAVYLKDG